MNIDTLTREKFPVKSGDILEISVPPDQDAAEKRFARIVNSAQVGTLDLVLLRLQESTCM